MTHAATHDAVVQHVNPPSYTLQAVDQAETSYSSSVDASQRGKDTTPDTAIQIDDRGRLGKEPRSGFGAPHKKRVEHTLLLLVYVLLL